ncbi:hypothetical protein Fcan01_21636 [Folsomia candida]|uniref:Uncharacterized protein n=1 Tax=Folsomia candida TaxID=158441 RepID=A0A226DG37_FOLCA|nr:hypothetical protein Fcan01_21636 [Folsomia candida]
MEDDKICSFSDFLPFSKESFLITKIIEIKSKTSRLSKPPAVFRMKDVCSTLLVTIVLISAIISFTHASESLSDYDDQDYVENNDENYNGNRGADLNYYAKFGDTLKNKSFVAFVKQVNYINRYRGHDRKIRHNLLSPTSSHNNEGENKDDQSADQNGYYYVGSNKTHNFIRDDIEEEQFEQFLQNLERDNNYTESGDRWELNGAGGESGQQLNSMNSMDDDDDEIGLRPPPPPPQPAQPRPSTTIIIEDLPSKKRPSDKKQNANSKLPGFDLFDYRKKQFGKWSYHIFFILWAVCTCTIKLSQTPGSDLAISKVEQRSSFLRLNLLV